MKFLVAGLGSAGQRHVRNLQQLAPQAQYTAWRVRGRNLVILDPLNAQPGRPEDTYNLRVVTDLAEGLAERPDAVIVANPISMHCDTALAAARAGCAVFVEKPLADRWDGVEELLAISQRNRLVTMVGYQMRFHPALRRVKQHLDDERIGPPVSARIHFGEYLPDMHPYEDYRDSHAARRAEGGGVILCLSHEIDIAMWLFGMPTAVHAVGGQLSQLDVDVEDAVVILMAYARDGKRLPVSVSLDFIQRPTQRNGEIVCERGTLRWDLTEPSVSVYDAARRAWEVERFPEFERNQLFLDEMTNFLRCIERRETTLVPAESAARTLRVALAAKASLAIGQSVPITERPVGAGVGG